MGTGAIATREALPEGGAGRSRIARLGAQIGMSAGELAALLAFYDACGGQSSDVARFVRLLTRYQRFLLGQSAGFRRKCSADLTEEQDQ